MIEATAPAVENIKAIMAERGVDSSLRVFLNQGG